MRLWEEEDLSVGTERPSVPPVALPGVEAPPRFGACLTPSSATAVSQEAGAEPGLPLCSASVSWECCPLAQGTTWLVC